MILYPIVIFDDKKIRTFGAAIGGIAVIALTVIGLLNPPVYSTEIMRNGEKYTFDDTYKVSLADEKYGSVEIVYLDVVEDYMVHAEFKKAGKTVLTLESKSGEKAEYDLFIERNTYEIMQR